MSDNYGKLVRMGLLTVFHGNLLVPLLGVIVLVYFRHSPVLLAHYPTAIMSASSEATFPVCHVALLLFLDWAWLTTTILGNIFIISGGFVPLIGISLAIRSLRYLFHFMFSAAVVDNARNDCLRITSAILFTETWKQNV